MTTLPRSALVDWHSSWFQPNNATLIVAGDVTLAELMPALERSFGNWQRGDAAEQAAQRRQLAGPRQGAPDRQARRAADGDRRRAPRAAPAPRPTTSRWKR